VRFDFQRNVNKISKKPACASIYIFISILIGPLLSNSFDQEYLIDDYCKIYLPSNWVQVPSEVYDSYSDNSGLAMDYAFQPDDCDWFQCSYIGVKHITKHGKVSIKEMEKNFSSNNNEELEKALNNISGVSGDLSGNYYDKQTGIGWMIAEMSYPDYRLMLVSTAIPTQKGLIQITHASSPETFDNEFMFFKRFIEKVSVNESIKYNKNSSSTSSNWWKYLASGLGLALALRLFRTREKNI